MAGFGVLCHVLSMNDGVVNKAYMLAGFVFLIVSAFISEFFPVRDRPLIIEEILYSAFLAMSYCWMIGLVGVSKGRVFSRLPLLAILAIMLIPLLYKTIGPAKDMPHAWFHILLLVLLAVLPTMLLPPLYKWWSQRCEQSSKS